jgi:hypothetical protein
MSPRLLDYYAVLQVAPDAEPEVIDAAYRQLMRKYHPDVAGGNSVVAAEYTERAKAINQAYAVLRDAQQRQAYDRIRARPHVQPTTVPNGRRPSPPPPPPPPPSPYKEPEAEIEPADSVPPESAFWSAVSAPFTALSTAYFLLPGPYEWEPRGRREFASTWLIPPLAIVLWLATTGRLAPWLGRSPWALLLVWVAVGLILVVTNWNAAPRLAVAGGAMLLLMSGSVDSALIANGVPIWVVWSLLICVSLALAARQFVFGIVPSIGLCWLISRFA